MKKVHLIANAHIDPIWQWEWEEGAACAVSTFRTAVEICEANPDFIFCHNESLLYEWIEQFDPSLFARIEKLVAEDRWHIMGAWVDQPDCNMPSGESFIRQMRLGKGYFMKKFGKTSTCAINLDPFGHTRGMVQLMKKAGFKHYIICRPDPTCYGGPTQDCFKWKGYDGSEITVRWTNGYSSSLGRVDTSKIEPTLKNYPDMQPGIILWGVGDHGGGPSKQDIEIIKRLRKEHTDVELIHSTPDAYFEERENDPRPMQVIDKPLNPWAVGCYTSSQNIKLAHRKLEEMLSYTEKICAHAAQMGLMEYPFDEIREAEYDACLCEFHDVLPGSSMESAEKSAVRTLNHGLEIVSRLSTRAFFRLSASQPKAKPGELPVMVYNPHPYPVKGEFIVEFMLHDQNWEPYWTRPRIFKDGIEVPSQLEKEASSIPLDWRKRLVFSAELEPMSVNRFDVNLDSRYDVKPVPSCPETDDRYVFENKRIRAEISKRTGLLESYKVDGVEYLTGAVRPVLVDDNCDPWGMTVERYDGKVTEFRLATKEETKRYCANEDGHFELEHKRENRPELEPVHVIESGDVRTTIESLLVCEGTYVLMRYTLPADGTFIDVNPHISFAARNRILKLVVPTACKDEYLGQQPYGYEALPADGSETCAQRWVMAKDGRHALSVLTQVYGSDFKDGTLRLSLLHGAAYTAHPLGDAQVLPGDRYMQRQAQGENDFCFRLNAGNACERLEHIERESAVYWEKPVALNFFPAAVGNVPGTLCEVDGNGVILGAFKQAEDGEGFIARVFNSVSSPRSCALKLPAFGTEKALELGAFEVRTLYISRDGKDIHETDILA